MIPFLGLFKILSGTKTPDKVFMNIDKNCKLTYQSGTGKNHANFLMKHIQVIPKSKSVNSENALTVEIFRENSYFR